MIAYAHSHPDRPDDPSSWEPLFTPFGPAVNQCQERLCEKCRDLDPAHGHLNKVAWWTAHFAVAMFPRGPDRDAAWLWGYLAGLWHDLGKFPVEWQNYLKAKTDIHSDEVTGKIDHSTAGAQHARKTSLFGVLLSYVIAGHHAGLVDGTSSIGAASALNARLTKEVLAWNAPEIADRNDSLPPPPLSPGGRDDQPHKVAFFTRMIFSSLVDADFLATESFMAADRCQERPVWPDNILQRMLEALDVRLNSFPKENQESAVNRERRGILEACVQRAEGKPGLFTLTVPTGGGKTLSSLAFALRHAIKNGLRRVIYVIPFTSIIEQNADVFRFIFTDLERELRHEVVIEHHSNLDPARATTLNRLASENWDAPLVITTNVQFFESLFVNRTSRCRKLHRIAQSVVIFDEAQTLPVSFLKPCLSVLRLLLQDYGSTLVLCTATQPAIILRDDFKIGLHDAIEIVRDVPALFAALRRTQVFILGKLNDDNLIARMLEHPSFLTVVNTRRHAAELFAALEMQDGDYHLSAQMCADHRSACIAEIRQRLKDRLPTRVISTQLIEAGVDLDFPVVFRSLAGLDSIAQAAGRCNREGQMPEFGKVFVFESDRPIPRGHLRQTADTARSLLTLPDILSPDAIRTYFENHYWKRESEWDARQILAEFQLPAGLLGFQYKTVAENFRLIDQEMKPVIVPYGSGWREVISELRHVPFPDRNTLRRAQRLMVQLHPLTFSKLVASGHVRSVDEDGRFHELTDGRLYDLALGLRTDTDAFYSDPETLMAT